MMRMAGHHRSGYSLLEMLVYVVILTSIVTVCAGIFSSSMRLNDIGTATFDRARHLDEVRNEFAEAVRSGAAIVPAAWEYHTNDRQLVIETAEPETDDIRHYIVFGCLKSPEALTRLEFSGEGDAFTLDHMETYGIDFASVSFEYNAEEPANARLVTLVTTVEGEGSGHRPVTPRCFAAALRGIASGRDGQ